MKFLIFLVAIYCLLISCDNRNESKVKAPPTKTKSIDTSNFTILNFSKVAAWLFKNVQPTTLDNTELAQIDSLLDQYINLYNAKQKRYFDSISHTHPDYKPSLENYIIDLTKYKRQYLPVINSVGQKEVWVNCFCMNYENWRQQIVSAKDGGNCFFNLEINLETKIIYQFRVNGEA